MNKTLCAIPFKELYFQQAHGGAYSACCLFNEDERVDLKNMLNSDIDNFFSKDKHFTHLRQEMLAGKKPKACERCWKLEDDGVQSPRQKYNKFYEGRNYDIDVTELSLLDIRLSNKCNLQCKMCSEDFSDQIGIAKTKARDETYNELQTGFKYDRWHVKKTNADENIFKNALNIIRTTPTIKKIKLAGGEPMIMDEVEDFLQAIIDCRRTDIEVFMITNCTTVRSKILDILAQFDKVEISCSIDGVGKYIEYQRFPCKWSVIDKNFSKLAEYDNIWLTLTPCITMFNLLGLPDFLQWTHENRGKWKWLAFNEVTWPAEMHWELVPLEYRTGLKNAIEKYIPLLNDGGFKVDRGWHGFAKIVETKFRTLDDPMLIERIQNNVKYYDHFNPIKLTDHCPWVEEWL